MTFVILYGVVVPTTAELTFVTFDDFSRFADCYHSFHLPVFDVGGLNTLGRAVVVVDVYSR